MVASPSPPAKGAILSPIKRRSSAVQNCPTCAKEFHSAERLDRHRQLAGCGPTAGPYHCWLETCERSFWQTAHLNNHRLVHVDERRYSCQTCSARFAAPESLSLHLRLLHAQDVPKERYTCSHCPKTFSVLEYLQLHEEYHLTLAPITRLACTQPACTAEFFTAAKLNWHLYEAHYRDASPLSAAEADNSAPVPPTCRCCRRQFESSLEMLTHRLECERTAERLAEQFCCASCGKVFSASRFLANHSLSCSVVTQLADMAEPMPKRPRHSENVKGIVPLPTTATPRFYCDHISCSKVFGKQVQLRNHLYSHSRYPFFCSAADCSAGFAQQHNYVQHAAAAHPEAVIQLASCDSCDQDFSQLSQLEAHKEEAHEEEEDAEQLLGDSFSEELDVVEHTAAFVCKMDHCTAAGFSRRQDLRRHYILDHNDTLVTCSKCNQRFGDRESLKEHLLDQHEGGTMELEQLCCPLCGANFVLKRLLNIHLVSAHPRPWVCSTCSQPTNTLLAAKRHRLLHLPKVCDACPQTFPRYSLLLEHMRNSHSHLILSCPVPACSSKYFSSTTAYEEHMLGHQKDKVFRCASCEYQGYNMRQLEAHLLSAHKFRPRPSELTSETDHCCPHTHCTETFASEIELFEHKEIDHTNATSPGAILNDRLPHRSPRVSPQKQPAVFQTPSPHRKGRLGDGAQRSTPDPKFESPGGVRRLPPASGRVRRFTAGSLEASEQIENCVVAKFEPLERLTEKLEEAEEGSGTRVKAEYGATFRPSPPKELAVPQSSLGKAASCSTPPGSKQHQAASCSTPPGSKQHQAASCSTPPGSKQHQAASCSTPPGSKQHQAASCSTPPGSKQHQAANKPGSPGVTIKVEKQDSPPLRTQHSPVNCNSKGVAVTEVSVRGTILRKSPSTLDKQTFKKPAPPPSISIKVENQSGSPPRGDRQAIKKPVPPPSVSIKLEQQDCLQPNTSIREEYSKVISKGGCPAVGDFRFLFGITWDDLVNRDVPRIFYSDDSYISKGLAIDLMQLSSERRLADIVLARYLCELLPPGSRPPESELRPEAAARLTARVDKLRVQAARFRSGYSKFPQYLEKFLLEPFQPFQP